MNGVEPPQPKPRLLGLLRRRECVVPTWRGWLLITAATVVVCLLLVLRVHPFLAVSDGQPGGVLVVEGWATDVVIETAVKEFRRSHYDRIFFTGGPLEYGAPLAEYHTYAERGAAVAVKLGLDPKVVQAVPSPAVRQDRTYSAALSMERWYRVHGPLPANVHLFTEGPHARRSRLLFEKALGENTHVCVTAVFAGGYDPARWWESSSGVRIVISEALAYCYSRLLFRP